jgi:AraC family transcriptional regulator
MNSIAKDLAEFRSQLEKGSVPRAYQALLSYTMGLRTHFNNTLAGSTVSDLYQGYMDITYFALFPASLKDHSLKIAIVFNYDAFGFEAWLAGRNRKVQRQYWELFKNGRWPEYRVVTPAKGIYSILECDLATDFDLDDPDVLTASIETATVAFIGDIERFLFARGSPEQTGRRR